MTTGIEAKLFRCLTDHLDTFATAQSLSVAKPNIPFTPTPGTPYLKAWLLPASTDSNDIEGITEDHQGVFQVSCWYPQGAGPMAVTEAASLVAAHYRRQKLTHESLSLKIVKPPALSPLMEDDGWAHIAVSIRYRALLDT